MFNDQKHRLSLLVALVLLGILGDANLRAFPWGLNASLWLALILGLHVAYRRGVGAEMTAGVRWALGAAFFFGLLISWRDAPGLKGVNVVVVLISITIAGALAAERDLRHAWITAYLTAARETLSTVLRVPARTLPQFTASARIRERSTKVPILAILRGVLIALPLLFVFGAFFFSADASFELLVGDLFDFNVYDVAHHLLIVAACVWFATAVVAVCLVGPRRTPPRLKPFFPPSLGAIEVNVVLALINLLFLSFVIIQFQYFFGAGDRIVSEPALTYSEYARRGFFELAAVSALALVLLLTCARLVDESGPAAKRVFAVLGCVLIALVLVILASSLYRMSLYVGVYGLTRLRYYTAAYSIWLGFVYIWLAFTFVRDRATDFAFGFLLSGYAAAFLLQASNPDAVMTRVNVARFQDGKDYDRAYALSLSADAVPELINALPTMPPRFQVEIRSAIESEWRRVDDPLTDLRTWSWARHQAAKAVHDSAAFE